MFRRYKLISVGSLLWILCSCAHTPQPKIAELPTENTSFEGAISLALKPQKGQVEMTVNCSHAVTETYEQTNILHKRIEDLDFKVRTTTKNILPNGNLLQDTETIKRDGPGSLHDLAYPELAEVISMEIDPQGKVVKAGNYPKDSLFYLPSIPLPDHPVKQGEEWVSSNSWKSPGSDASLTVELRLKAVGKKRCGDHLCVNIVVTGSVTFPKLPSKSHFEHGITGRFLFDQERGLVPWSEFLSEEQVKALGGRAVVHSKLRSELVEPRGYRTINREEPACPFATSAE